MTKQIFAYKGRGFVPLLSTLQAVMQDIRNADAQEAAGQDAACPECGSPLMTFRDKCGNFARHA